MSELYELPNGWEWKKLIDVCEFINGKAYKKEELLNMGKYPVLRVGNFFTNNNWYYSDLELPENKYCDKGDLLYAWSASFGPKIWDGEKSIYHYHIWKLIPNYNFISKQYLYWLLDWDVEQIKSDQGTGTTMMHVTKGSMESRIVPIPKLSEQQRIVSKLDLLFNKIDKSIELHKKNMDESNTFMGSALNEVFGELKEKYDSAKMNNVVTKDKKSIKRGPFGSALKKSFFVESGYLVYEQFHALNNDFSMERYFIDEEKFNELKAFEVKAGDIIISCSGVYLGKLAIIPNNYSKGIINQALLKLTLDKNIIIDKFFVFFWNNLMNNGFFDEVKKGAAIPNMPSVKELKEIDIPLPPLSIQQKVVEYLDSVSEKMEKVKSIQKEKMESLKALKASILDKAFRGEL